MNPGPEESATQEAHAAQEVARSQADPALDPEEIDDPGSAVDTPDALRPGFKRARHEDFAPFANAPAPIQRSRGAIEAHPFLLVLPLADCLPPRHPGNRRVPGPCLLERSAWPPGLYVGRSA